MDLYLLSMKKIKKIKNSLCNQLVHISDGVDTFFLRFKSIFRWNRYKHP